MKVVQFSGHLSIEDFREVVFNNVQLESAPVLKERIMRNFSFLSEFSKDKIIYGVNTGFGPMAQFRVENDKIEKLQYNLIRSHASGSGHILSDLHLRSIVLARLCSLAQCKSGVHMNIIDRLIDLLNHNVLPVIYEHGGVGASGDLVQLAHLALALIGEGEVRYKGQVRQTEEVFEELGIKPIEIHIREGLAIMNGTSAMTGIGLVNVLYAQQLLTLEVHASTMINEMVRSLDDHFSKSLNGAKPHKGQNKVADQMRAILRQSKLIRKREDIMYKIREELEFSDKVQEYYSLRCVPQILGPVSDAIDNALEVLMNELNSANDNPIVDDDSENVYHGGNFHGDYIGFEMDKLRIGITKLSMMAERHVNFLCNDKLNNILPPFVNHGTLGLNLGVQGTVFTATSTTAENQTLSTPMYTHSIPNNNDNMDIVSMGCNSALLTSKVISNTFEVVSIEYLTILQAIDYLDISEELALSNKRLYKDLRAITPAFKEDIVTHIETRKINNFFKEQLRAEVSVQESIC